ncbi:hypothetical protein [Streptomyces sp. S5]|uniref:hypothetical protein n=1 Tax=Streptomyces TaxID=1883 RepID=UPI00351A256A
MVTTMHAVAPAAGVAGEGPVDEVARLAAVDGSLIEQMRAEALGAPTRGVQAYSEYQSGGWWTASLMNHSASGDPHDVVIGDGRPEPTSLYVRLARLAPNSFLWEHRDYAEVLLVELAGRDVPAGAGGWVFAVAVMTAASGAAPVDRAGA